MSTSAFTNDTRVVTTVRVVVHTTGPWPNGMSDNHWSIFLLLAENISVRMNMTAELNDPTGFLKWTTLNYVLTQSAIEHWDFKTASNVTVSDIYRLVTGNHRDEYKMSGGGSGCRWWM